MEGATVPPTVDELVIPRAVLEAQTGPIQGKVVFSTNPQTAISVEGVKYVTKGAEDPRIVLAEVVGHLLARQLRIPVPNFSVGDFTEDLPSVFASELQEDAFREVEYWLRRGRVVNPHVLLKTVLLDIWIVNPDRNIGNFIGRAASDSDNRIELVAIDFEKAATLREPHPIVMIPTISPKELWPSGDLGDICWEKVHVTRDSVAEIQSITDGLIDHILDKSIEAVGMPAETKESAAVVLKTRRDNFEKIVREVLKK